MKGRQRLFGRRSRRRRRAGRKRSRGDESRAASGGRSSATRSSTRWWSRSRSRTRSLRGGGGALAPGAGARSTAARSGLFPGLDADALGDAQPLAGAERAGGATPGRITTSRNAQPRRALGDRPLGPRAPRRSRRRRREAQASAADLAVGAPVAAGGARDRTTSAARCSTCSSQLLRRHGHGLPARRSSSRRTATTPASPRASTWCRPRRS